jgi:type IV pilus assembly protein PilC
MEFQCRLGTAQGQVVEGVYVADDEARLRHDLEEKGLYVLAIKRKGGLALPGLPALRRRRVPVSEFLIFNQELATLLKAGMPLVQSLDILRHQVPNPIFKAVLDDVYERVRSGASLSEAFEAHGSLFPAVYTASLLAGEKSGSLDQVLRRYITYVKVIGSVKRKTVSALIYPGVLLVLAAVVVSVLVIRVVPAFADFYSTFSGDLPWSTRMLMGLSTGVRSNLLLILLVLVGLVAGAWFWLRQPAHREKWHATIMRLPFLGPVARKFATSQFARTLATLLGGGIPLVSALDVASRAVGNRFVGSHVEAMVTQVKEGQALSLALASRRVFPDVAVKMVEVGEATGALQDMLNALADFFDEDVETRLERFGTLVEPILLIVMGLVIAAVLLALYLPVFQLSSAVG